MKKKEIVIGVSVLISALGADNLSAPEEKMAEIIYDEIMREDSLFVWLHE